MYIYIKCSTRFCGMASTGKSKPSGQGRVGAEYVNSSNFERRFCEAVLFLVVAVWKYLFVPLDPGASSTGCDGPDRLPASICTPSCWTYVSFPHGNTKELLRGWAESGLSKAWGPEQSALFKEACELEALAPITLGQHLSFCIYICICIYILISLFLCFCVCIYIYIYLYLYAWAAPPPSPTPGPPCD